MKAAMRPVYIYALTDPRTDSIRYVGKTVELKERLLAHINDAKKGSKNWCHRWIRTLLAEGFEPKQRVLQCVSECEWAEAERRWIAHLSVNGAKLTNLTKGGDGLLGYVPTPEHIAKTSASNRGKKRTGQALENIRRGAADPATRAKLSAMRIGNKSRLGQKQSDEEKEKRAAANRGKKRSPEFCERLRALNTGKKHSSETRLKMSQAKTGRVLSEAERAVLDCARAARWAKAKERE